MPLFKSKKLSKEARKRYEHQMMLSNQNPDRVFDLSDCELSAIPDSLFAKCRILLTESLILHTNLLKSLKGGGNVSELAGLRILDLHRNRLNTLPENIGSLKNLQILNIENNNLEVLPSSIGELTKLQSLQAKDNFLNSLPTTIKNMKSLRTVDISGTNKVQYLPKTICKVRTLETLVLGSTVAMEYPDPDTASLGLEAIQKFICKDCGLEYIPPSQALLDVLDEVDGSSSSKIQPPLLLTQTSFDHYQRGKDDKKKLNIEMAREMEELKHQQIALAAKAKEKQLIDRNVIKEEIKNTGKAIQKQQEIKDQEKTEMLRNLKLVEETATSLVQQLLNMNERSKKQDEMLLEMEKQRIKEEEHFKVTQEDLDNLRKKETLAAMESVLSENAQYSIMIQKYLGEQNLIMRKAQKTMGKDSEKISQQLNKQLTEQEALVRQVQHEENLQKEAFAVLQFQQDAIQNRLIGQIKQLEDELIKLTVVEAKRNLMKMKSEQKTLQDVRTELTDLLIVLLKEKDSREEVLRQRLIEMEQQKDDDQVDFWIVQYQRLMDSKPMVLIQKEQALDIDVIKVLQRADAEVHTPEFIRHRITADNLLTLDDEKLTKIGVYHVGLRQNILREIENLIAQHKKVDVPYDMPTTSVPVPVTIPTITPSPSAPTLPEEENDEEVIDNECVVCLDNTSDCVFLPCGHVCSCFECAQPLHQCPMCRADITQKIRIFRS